MRGAVSARRLAAVRAAGREVREERAAGARFDYVVTTRADLAFEAPIRDASRVDPRYWYSAPDPPGCSGLAG